MQKDSSLGRCITKDFGDKRNMGQNDYLTTNTHLPEKSPQNPIDGTDSYNDLRAAARDIGTAQSKSRAQNFGHCFLIEPDQYPVRVIHSRMPRSDFSIFQCLSCICYKTDQKKNENETKTQKKIITKEALTHGHHFLN